MSYLKQLILLRRTNIYKNCNINRLYLSYPKFYATKNIQKEVEEDNRPIKFSATAASKWQAQFSRTGTQPRLWYEPYVLMGSVAVFLIYFCIFREENDIDAELERTIYSRISGLEEHQLRLLLDYNEKNGLSTRDIINRLHEIESSKTNEV